MRSLALLPALAGALGQVGAAAAAAASAASVQQELVERYAPGSKYSSVAAERDIFTSLAEEIWRDMEDAATTCTACEAILVLAKGAADLGDTVFVDVFTEICDLSGAEDSDVCAGVLAREGPVIAQDLRGMSIGSKTSEVFCTTFFGLCPYPAVAPYNVSFPSPKPSTGRRRPTPSGETPIKVVHFSDIHVDPFYVTGAATNCTKPICCRDYDAADAPGDNSSPAGPNGDHSCDSPKSLEESMYEAIASMVPDAAFTLFTGDIVDHAVWNTTEPQNIIDMNDAYGRMASAGLATVFGTAGNHEASPVNFFPPPAVGDESRWWVYDTLSSDWSRWIGTDGASQAQSFGAYGVQYASGNLRIISLNTNMYYIDNFYLYTDPMETDPAGQLAWLVSQLDAAEGAGERVYIMAHMPLGLSDALHDGSNYLDQIVNRYSATIAAMFFGHTHLDHFEISYSDYSDRTPDGAQAVSYIMPSLTPTSGMPSFRVYLVDPVTFAVMDAVTYAADMGDPSFQTAGPRWSPYYSARDAYGPLVSPPLPADAELSPAFWHNLTEVLAANDTAFDEYYARKSRGWNVQSCTGGCVTDEICGLQSARAQDNCYTPSPGVSFARKRGVEDMAARATAHRDECGVALVRSTMAQLVSRRDLLEHLERRVVEKRSLERRPERDQGFTS